MTFSQLKSIDFGLWGVKLAHHPLGVPSRSNTLQIFDTALKTNINNYNIPHLNLP